MQGKTVIYPVPPEIRSDHFRVTIDGKEAPVAHAASNYYFLNFAVKGKAAISITAESEGFWGRGVEVQPWRWGIRPTIDGRTITFSIAGPAKLSISRPGDHAANSEMLFLFANAPETLVPKMGSPRLRYYGPGTYHENLDPKSGDSIYLAPGALVFGALNLWGVENVKVFGRGTIVYDGPQDPDHDQGWMHNPDWHVIGMDHANNVQISGITCIVRSRTWMIQMLGSHHIGFDNVKVIGGCPGNANQDGMDWLGGGDAIINDCFFRASDDVFALYGNWLGYDPQALTTPGETVENIRIQNSVVSTSISNVVRVSWPQKVFDSRHFKMTNSDIIHMGRGGCKIPFGLLEIWDDPDGKGDHTDYSFENIRLEDWYSLLQLRQHSPRIEGVTLKNIWALETPSLVESVLSGQVSKVVLENVNVAAEMISRNRDLPIRIDSGAAPPSYSKGEGPHASFAIKPYAIRPGAKVRFDASRSAGSIKQYEWSFGDGRFARGRVVRHAFPDENGTLLDGSGRFRVILKVSDASGREDWFARPVIVKNFYLPGSPANANVAEFQYKYYEGASLNLGDFSRLTPVATGATAFLNVSNRKRAEDYGFVFDGVIDVPVDGGYSFVLIGNDTGEVEIDSREIARSPSPKTQVCGMTGNMTQLATGNVGLKAGKHAVHVSMTHSAGPDRFAVMWEGPTFSLTKLNSMKPAN